MDRGSIVVSLHRIASRFLYYVLRFDRELSWHSRSRVSLDIKLLRKRVGLVLPRLGAPEFNLGPSGSRYLVEHSHRFKYRSWSGSDTE